MITTISVEAIDKLMNRALDDYSKKSSLISTCIDGGLCAGIYQVAQELAGFPKEKLEQYENRLNGIGEIKHLTAKN